ncbi:MAG: hypothetical protein ABL907_19390 [Hyphomicrobium sp.]
MAIAVGNKKLIQLVCTRMSFVVLTMCSVATGYAGIELADGHYVKTPVFAVLMAIMPWAAAYMLPVITMAKDSGRPIAAVGLAVVFAGAVAAEWIGETMVFAGQRQTTTIKASMQDARYNNAAKSVAVLEKRLATAQAVLDQQAPYGASAAYTAQITEADGLAKREGSKDRGGCKRRCDDALKLAGDLRAHQAIALTRETKTEPEVASLTAELKEARATAGAATRGNSIAAASAGIMATISTLSLSPDGDSTQWANIWLGVFLATVLTVLGIGLSYAGVTDWDAPRGARRRSKLLAWLKGEQSDDQPTPHVARETVNTPATIQPLKPAIEYTRLGDAARILGSMKTA